jgi:hypothetical protein
MVQVLLADHYPEGPEGLFPEGAARPPPDSRNHVLADDSNGNLTCLTDTFLGFFPFYNF